MGVKLGTLDISAFKVGSGECTVYLGTELIYSGDTPTPPTPSLKFQATYTGGTTYSAECDSSSGLTTATTKPSGYESSSMTDAVIGDCITSIGNSVFEYCESLTSVTIPNSVTSIGNTAFHYCTSLSSITIPNSVTSIGNVVFEHCESLTSVTIPDSVATIDIYAFYHCNSLESVNIGSGITSIGDEAFGWCTGLTSVTVNATTPPTLGNDAFDFTNDCPIYVPSGSVSTFQSASGWSSYSSRIFAIPSPTPTGDTWFVYSAGTTVSGTFGGVRISTSITINDGEQITFDDPDYESGGETYYANISYGMLCVENGCTEYCCDEYDEQTGECISWSPDCCGTEECVSYAMHSRADFNAQEEWDVMQNIDGYDTYEKEITIYDSSLPFDIELLVTNS